MKLFGSLRELVSAVFRKSGNEVTLQPGTVSANTTFELPVSDGGTKELADTTSSQALSSKSLTSPEITGTVTGDALETDLSVSAGAGKVPTAAAAKAYTDAVAASQNEASEISYDNSTSGLAATDVQAAVDEVEGRVDTAESAITTNASDISTVSSDLSTHIADTSTHGVTGDVVGTTDVQTLEQKTLDAATVGGSANDGTDGFLLLKDQSADPTAATGDDVKLFAKDKGLFKVDSSGVASEVGSGTGSGEKNYIENPSASIAITGWTAVGNLTVARTVTPAQLPRENTTGSAILITATPATTQSTSDYVYTDFDLDDVDLGKKLKIQFDQLSIGTYTTGQFEVYVASQASRGTPLHTPVTTDIPAKIGTFLSNFDASTTTTLSLVIRATGDMTDNDGIALSDVILGPGIRGQGAVVTAWESYTPTTQGIGTPSSVNVEWRRVGEGVEIRGYLTTGTVSGSEFQFGLPNSYTVGGAGSSTTHCGSIERSSSLTSSRYIALATQGDTFLNVGRMLSGSANNPLSAANGNSAFGSTEKITIQAFVPVQELAGSGTLNVLQEDNLKKWTAYTPTVANNGSKGFTNTAYWQRVGTDMHIRFLLNGDSTASASTTGNSFTMTIPDGYTMTTDYFPSASFTSDGNVLGWFFDKGLDTASARSAMKAVFPASSTTLQFAQADIGGSQSSASIRDSDLNNTNDINIQGYVIVPITEFSNTQPSLVGFSQATADQAGLVFKSQYIVDQNQSSLSNATTTDIDSGTLTLPAGTYLAELGALCRVVTTVDPSAIRADLLVTKTDNTLLGTGQTWGGLNETSNNNWFAQGGGMTEFTLTEETTVKLRGSINVSGGTVTSRNFDDAYLKVTKQ